MNGIAVQNPWHKCDWETRMIADKGKNNYRQCNNNY